MADLSFPTKSSYLEWRTDKRAEYAALSEYQRELRLQLSVSQRDAALRINAERALAEKEGRVAKWKRLRTNVAPAWHNRAFIRGKAREIMAERAAAKVVAGAAWETWQQSNEP